MDDGFAWLYYVRTDENHRPAEVFRHRIGSDPSADARVFEEHDPGLFIHISRSQSARFRIISVYDQRFVRNAICSILPSSNATPCLVEPRVRVCATRSNIAATGFLSGQRRWSRGFQDHERAFGEPARPVLDRGGPDRRGCMIIKVAVYPDYLLRMSAKQACRES